MEMGKNVQAHAHNHTYMVYTHVQVHKHAMHTLKLYVIGMQKLHSRMYVCANTVHMHGSYTTELGVQCNTSKIKDTVEKNHYRETPPTGLHFL